MIVVFFSWFPEGSEVCGVCNVPYSVYETHPSFHICLTQSNATEGESNKTTLLQVMGKLLSRYSRDVSYYSF